MPTGSPGSKSSAVAGLLLTMLGLALSGCSRRTDFLERSVSASGQIYRYRVWLPPHYTKLRRWPVVLYLHGSGERGDDNVRQIGVGLAPALEHFKERYECVVVFPQCADGQEWYGPMEQMALAALDQTVTEFHGDPRRIALTGISMGGAGAWYMGRHQKRFASIVPVCGEVERQPGDPFPGDPPPDLMALLTAPDPYAALARAIGATPVWAVHGAEDDVVPVTESRSMTAALTKAGGTVHYTEVPGAGHDVWDRAYADEALVRWMLEQRLPRPILRRPVPAPATRSAPAQKRGNPLD